MKLLIGSLALLLSSLTFAARPFINEPDTGIQEFLGPDFPKGKLVDLKDIWCINDFEYSARNFLNATAYTWIRTGVGGEYTYRNNLEIFPKVGFKQRVLTGASNINASMHTTILGHNFSAPIFISPAATPGLIGGYIPPGAESGLPKGAYNQGILYIPAMYAEMPMEQMAQEQGPGQVRFQQFYAKTNKTFNQQFLSAAESTGSKAIVWTVDAPADGPRILSERYTLPASTTTTLFTWDTFTELQSMTPLPIIPKGIYTVEDAREAINRGARAIILSNHGGKHLDGTRSPLQTALEIHDTAPEIFSQIDVLADCGVRYGTDVLKLLALGVKAVGLGRSFLYANLYNGSSGVERAIDLLKKELFLDAVNLGVTDLRDLNSSWSELDYLRANQWNLW